MRDKLSHIGWMATAVAISGLAMTPALSRVLSSESTHVSLNSLEKIGLFTVAGADPDIAAQFKQQALHSNNKFKFTPSGGNRDGDRAVTVVVRQRSTNHAVNIRENILAAQAGAGMGIAAKVAPVSYSLGAAKGLSSFTIPVKKLSNNLPDLSQIGAGRDLDSDTPAKKSRFNSRISIEGAAQGNTASRALATDGNEFTLDVGGSYSLTKNLDVTAGVRLNNKENDRLAPLTDARQDSQAVYVGTQFRF